MRKNSALLLGLFTCLSLNSFGQVDSINVVTTAVPMLRISPDARAGGMGDLGIATSADANAAFFNRAKLPFATQRSAIAITYTPWLKDLGLNDVFIGTVAGYHQIDELQTISGSLRYFNLGSIQFTDFSGNDLQKFNPREFAIDGGYSRKLSDRMGIAVALRFIYSNLGTGSFNGATLKPGTAVSGDVSYYYNNISEEGNGLAAGVTLSNLGSKIAYTQDANSKDYIPANLGIGAIYQKRVDESNVITFGVDLNKLLVPTPPGSVRSPEEIAAYRNKSVVGSWFSSFGDAPGGLNEELQEIQISTGLEYGYNDQFFARAGYFHEARTKGNRRFFSVGAGVKYNRLGFNFSYLVPTGQGINRNPLSNTTRFSIIFDLGADDGSGLSNE